jgi:hypothetical protein
MTTITTDQLVPATNRRSLRNSILGFVAGAALASGAFLGVNAFGSSDAASPAPAASTPSVAVVHSAPAGCPVVHGNC